MINFDIYKIIKQSPNMFEHIAGCYTTFHIQADVFYTIYFSSSYTIWNDLNNVINEIIKINFNKYQEIWRDKGLHSLTIPGLTDYIFIDKGNTLEQCETILIEKTIYKEPEILFTSIF